MSELFKENLREEIKFYKEFSYGFTSTIYRKNNFVIKEIYLDKELEKSNKLNELTLNIYFKEHPMYGKYTVPFISYDSYDKILLLKFEYMGKNLEESLMDFSIKELKKIHKNITHALKVLNKKVTHQDLHIANIFVNPETLEIRIGDWGKGLLEPDTKDQDYKFYYESLNKSVKLALFEKIYTKAEISKMINTKVLKNKINKEMDYIRVKFPHKPKSFYPKLCEYVSKRIFNGLVEKTIEYKNIKESIDLN